MFTAKDMYEKIKQHNECPNIDFWIENTLYKNFIRSGNNVAKIQRNDIIQQGWKGEDFYQAMVQRGFSLVYACDETPLTGVYYEITF